MTRLHALLLGPAMILIGVMLFMTFAGKARAAEGGRPGWHEQAREGR